MPVPVSVSAMVTAPPGWLRLPKPLPGETMTYVVIRNFAGEWSNFLEKARADFQLDHAAIDGMRGGVMPASVCTPLAERILAFMNRRLPLQGRTVEAIADLRDHLAKNDFSKAPNPYVIGEILIPRQSDSSRVDPRQTQMLESRGARQIHVDGPSPGAIDFNKLLAEVRGDYLWIVGGGTTLFPFEVSRSLALVLRRFAEQPRLALYSDQAYCMVYRVAAIKTLIGAGKLFAADVRENGRLLHEAGYEVCANPDPLNRLAYLEKCYGGAAGPYDAPEPAKPWWKRLLGG